MYSRLLNTDFFEDKLESIRTKFLPSDSPDLFLFPSVPPPKLINFIFQPVSLKFTNSLLLLKVHKVPLIPSQFCFWNSASMKLVTSISTHWWSKQLSSNFKPQLSILSILLHSSSQKDRFWWPFLVTSSQTISTHWWSKQLSSNFKPQLSILSILLHSSSQKDRFWWPFT